MKCEHCGGAVVLDQGCYPEGERLKCINCGREPKTAPAEKEKVMSTEIKVCVKCQKPLPKTEEYFRKNRNNKDGFMSMCKKCRQEYEQDYRAGKRIRGQKAQGSKLKAQRRATKADLAPIRKAAPIQSASPEEIVATLRKGVAVEIIAMINERF